MSVETINGYVLLAEPADWSDNPTWTLKWDTEVAGTLRGNEGRSGLREFPRPALQYKVQPLHTHRQARLIAALTVGMATGKCCAPTWGRASWLAADAAVGATTIQIEPSPWAWAVDDWLLIYTDDGGHQTAQITGIDGPGTTFTLAAALTVAANAEAAVYPVFAGRPELTDIEQTNGSISSTTITLTGDEFVISATVPACCQTGGTGGGGGTGGSTAFGLLRTTWRALKKSGSLPDPVASHFGDVPTDPDLHDYLHRGCLRFLEVTAGSVTTTLGGEVPAEVTAATVAAAAGASGIFAVEFFGIRGPFRAGMHPRHVFTPSSNNYNIYLFPMT